MLYIKLNENANVDKLVDGIIHREPNLMLQKKKKVYREDTLPFIKF